MDWNALAKALDTQQPNWFISYANEQELKDFAYHVAFGDRTIVTAKESLRSSVVRRCFEVCRAAVHAGHLTDAPNLAGSA